jgi:hypothetical protein
MEKLIAFCGLDCSGCEAYLATQAEDQAAKLAVLEKWRVEYHAPAMPFEAVSCDGCTSSGRLGGYTHECPVHTCGRVKGVDNCAYCEDYPTCDTLQSFIADIESAKENLAAIRAGL